LKNTAPIFKNKDEDEQNGDISLNSDLLDQTITVSLFTDEGKLLSPGLPAEI
jgi:hypothetical protein